MLNYRSTFKYQGHTFKYHINNNINLLLIYFILKNGQVKFTFIRCTTFADISRSQAAYTETCISFPFSLPKANRKQLKMSAIQANRSDIQVTQSGN